MEKNKVKWYIEMWEAESIEVIVGAVERIYRHIYV